MRDLPGLYWDEERQRYFPQVSRPKPASSLTPSHTVRHTPLVSRSHNGPWKAQVNCGSFSTLRRIQRTSSTSCRDTERHSLIARRIATTSSCSSMHVPVVYSAPITALKVSDLVEGGQSICVGDRQGWCYAGETIGPIMAEVCLRSEISSIAQSIDLTVYTSFGPDPQLLVRNPATLESFLLRPSHLQDVRTSRLQGPSITLGMRKRALHFPNLENARNTHSLETHSDVFALHRDRHDVWTGTRNGTVRVFDLRSKQSQDTLGGRFHDRHISVTHVRRLREYQLLVAAIDGSLEIFDIRLSRSTASAIPLCTLTGNSNTFTYNLGITVDPSEDFIFAAGQDLRIRGWSLRTGRPLESALIPPDAHNPFFRTFAHPVYALQATSGGAAGTLWIASGTTLERFELGKRYLQATP